MAKTLLGEDNWKLALIHAKNGKYMTPEQKLARQAGGHMQYEKEFFKALEREKIRKDLGDEKYEKLKALSPEQRPYYTGKLPMEDDYPKDVSAEQRGMDRFGGSGKVGQRIDHDMYGHGYSIPQKTPSGAQQSALLGALGYREDAFEQPFFNRAGMAANPDDIVSNYIIDAIGANFIYNEIEVYEVHAIDDLDYGSFRVVGGIRYGDDESYEVNLTIQPSIDQHDDGTSLTTSDYDLDAPFTIIYDDDYAGAEREFDPSKQTEEEMRELFASDLAETYYNR
jgi:hypothetical protein